MAITIRTASPEEGDLLSQRLAQAFLGTRKPAWDEVRKATWEPARSYFAFDGDELVGTTGIHSFQMTTPGGMLATAGVTMVSVKPTHRRQGVLTDLMRAQLSTCANKERRWRRSGRRRA